MDISNSDRQIGDVSDSDPQNGDISDSDPQQIGDVSGREPFYFS